MYDYNHEMSECKTDLDCETMYMQNENYEDSVIVSNHYKNELYNGYYELAEAWGGYPHWAKENRTAHIYYYPHDNGKAYWLFDDRE